MNMKKILKSLLVILLIGSMKLVSAGIYYQGNAYLIATGNLGTPTYTLHCVGQNNTCCYVDGLTITIYHSSGTWVGVLGEAMPIGGYFPEEGVEVSSNDPIVPNE